MYNTHKKRAHKIYVQYTHKNVQTKLLFSKTKTFANYAYLHIMHIPVSRNDNLMLKINKSKPK